MASINLKALFGNNEANPQDSTSTTSHSARSTFQAFRLLLETTFDTSNEPIFLLDARSLTVLACNPAAERVFGYRPDEIKGQSMALLDGDPGHYEAFEGQVLAALDRDGAYRGESRLRRKDGSLLNCTDTIAEIRDDAGALFGLVRMIGNAASAERVDPLIPTAHPANPSGPGEPTPGVAQVRYVSEEIYRRIAEMANEGIWLIDLNARTTFVNRRMAEILGCTPEEMEDSTVLDFVFTEDVPLARERIGQNLQGRPEQFDFRFRRKDGTPVLVLGGTSPMVNAAGEIVGALGMFSDITDRKRAEIELEQTNSILNAVFESTTDAIFVKDNRGRYIMINKAGAEIIGKPPEEIIGKGDLELLSPEEAQTILAEDREVLALGAPHSFQDTLHVAGIARTLQTAKAPYRDSLGQVIGLVGIARDISESRRVAEQLARLAAIVQFSDDAIISKSIDGIIQTWNPGAERLFGYTAEEAIGKPIWIIYPPELQDEFSNIMGRLRRGEHIDHYETIRVRKDGTRLNISVSMSPIKDERGRIIGASKISRDITVRKRAEQAQQFLASASTLLSASLNYETTLESLARLAVPFLADWCVVYMLDEDGSIRRLAIEHRDPELRNLPRRIQDDFPLNPNASVGVPRVLRTGESEFYPIANAQLLAADAQDPATLTQLTVPLDVRSWMCVPLRTRGGRPFGAISFILTGPGRRYTYSDLALAEELARGASLAIDNARLYRSAQNAIELRDQFLSIASHELKTPLTALLGYVELLQRYAARDKNIDVRIERALGTIHESALRLNSLIRSLLDVSRIQEGRFVIEHRRVDLDALVRRLVTEVQPVLKNHQLEYGGPGRPVLIEGDELRLEQVIQNLIQNAVKYSIRGGVIRISLQETNGMAALSVTDSGIGIPAAALPLLFSRFYRAENAEKMHIGGMGIGLYVVKEIVNLHGGTVEVRSKEENGSTFTVCLPLLQQAGRRSPPARANAD